MNEITKRKKNWPERTVVLSIGGSVLMEGALDEIYGRITTTASVIVDAVYSGEVDRLGVVVGGGRYARNYIHLGRRLGMDEFSLDEIGISFTRLNASLLLSSIIENIKEITSGERTGDRLGRRVMVNRTIPITVEEAARILSEGRWSIENAGHMEESVRMEEGRIVVMGGTVPGHTTDAVSAMLAREVQAEILLNATNVDGVYTSDPRKDPHAVKLTSITYKSLLEVTRSAMGKAGANVVFDPVGVEIIAEDHMPTFIFNGTDTEVLRKALRGEHDKGTLVSDVNRTGGRTGGM